MSDQGRDEASAIGLRAQADKVCVAVLQGTQEEPRLVDRQILEAPARVEMPEVLASLRAQLVDVIKKYDVKRIGVRLPESNARGGNKEGVRNRMRIDGMLMEVAGTLRLDVIHGALTTIAKALGTKDKTKYRDAQEFRGLSLADVQLEMREAILVGAAALPRSAS